MTHTNIFCIGPRGSGKSTVGRALAAALAYAFVDTDALVVRREGADIAHIVATHGWVYFRQAESRALREAVAARTVVATGGGIVLDPANVACMRAHGCVVYLKADVPTLAARLNAQPAHGQRPSLTGEAMLDEIAAVLHARESLYHGAAHYVLNAALPVHVIVQNIMDYAHVW